MYIICSFLEMKRLSTSQPYLYSCLFRRLESGVHCSRGSQGPTAALRCIAPGRESQMAQLKRSIADVRAKWAQQKNLYEAVLGEEMVGGGSFFFHMEVCYRCD